MTPSANTLLDLIERLSAQVASLEARLVAVEQRRRNRNGERWWG